MRPRNHARDLPRTPFVHAAQVHAANRLQPHGPDAPQSEWQDRPRQARRRCQLTMIPCASATQVMDALQRVKASAPAFATNFFPMQKKLEAWIGHGELFCESRTGAAFFFRKDRDLWHLHFAANDPETLLRQIETVDEL